MTEMILLSEAQMARISPFFPLSHGVPRVDDRRVVSGIIFVIRNDLRAPRKIALTLRRRYDVRDGSELGV